jgi:hypothetical protein
MLRPPASTTVSRNRILEADGVHVMAIRLRSTKENKEPSPRDSCCAIKRLK